MVVTYSTAALVSGLLQIDDFSGTTTPTQTEVEAFINRAEDYIDEYTNKAWRATTIAREQHSFWPYNLYRLYYPPRVHLKHPFVKTFSGASGDKLEVFEGTSYTDWIADAGHTEGRGTGDFFVNYEDGVIYFEKKFPLIWRPDQVRVTYRYGETTVPKWVEDVATKMAAMDVLLRWQEFPGGGQDIPTMVDHAEVIRMWREDVAKVLDANSWLWRDKRPFVV